MIRVLFLDFGETLVHEGKPFPHVPEALDSLHRFETADGRALEIGLVSDFTLAEPPITAKKVAAIFDEYVGILDAAGLKERFEPLDRRVTLSTHAGAYKPDRRVFETALERLGASAGLKECLFITENEDHLAACATLGMKTLRFDRASSGDDSFSDWSEAPLRIAHLVAPKSEQDLTEALKMHLASTRGLRITAMERERPSKLLRVRAKSWQALSDDALGSLSGVRVELPVELRARLGPRGAIEITEERGPDPEALAEAETYVRSLLANHQVDLGVGAGPTPSGVTHEVVTTPEGQKRLQRKRFSAV